MKTFTVQSLRQQLLNFYKHGLDAVNGHTCVQDTLLRWTTTQRDVLESVHLLAIGKAAVSMTRGALQVLQGRLARGLVITKRGHVEGLLDPRLTILESDHPIPSSASLQAGAELIRFLESLPQQGTLLILISGGASALVEVLPEGCTLTQLDQLNQWLLSEPFSIQQVNRIRQSVSCIKGGRARHWLHAQRCLQLTLSDVAGNDLSVIGSGLFIQPMPMDDATPMPVIPAWVEQMQQQVHLQLDHASTAFESEIEAMIIADNQTARSAIANWAQDKGWRVVVNEPVSGEVTALATQISQTLRDGPPGLYIWGGEALVRLPEQPGMGGRCQSLALDVARSITGDERIVFLAAGTDGTDGPGDVAGALVDGATTRRGTGQGLDATNTLRAADAGTYLQQTGDLIDTGPTGSNVMDILLGLKIDPAQSEFATMPQ